MIPVNEPLLGELELEYVTECVKTNWVSSAGRFIERFESEWAEYCGRKHGVTVTNGTTALELAVSVLDLPPGSEIILPSFTIVSCLEAVLRAGHNPVLVDCDPLTYCMDVDHARRRLTPATRAVMPVHIYGHPVNMQDLLAFALENDLAVIEDAAEAHGAECEVNGQWRRCGGFGVLSTFSFYANKNITCGEGGMVLTDDDRLADKLRSGRNLGFGRQRRFLHESRGSNLRLSNLQAAIGCAQLQRIDEFINRKRELAALYRTGLSGLDLRLPHEAPWARSTIWMYAVTLGDSVPFDAEEFARRLLKRDVQTRPFFLGMHEQPVYHAMGLFRDEEMPVTEAISRRGLYLPSGQAISDSQIEYVVESVRAILK